VAISLAEYQRLNGGGEEPHLGRRVVEHLKGVGEIGLPSRKDHRPIPFADWLDQKSET
jgi:hypothetical protein